MLLLCRCLSSRFSVFYGCVSKSKNQNRVFLGHISSPIRNTESNTMKALFTETNETLTSTTLIAEESSQDADLLTQSGQLFAMGYASAGQILLEQFTPWDDISQVCKSVLNSHQFASFLSKGGFASAQPPAIPYRSSWKNSNAL